MSVPIIVPQTPITVNFNIVTGNIELTDLYGSTGIYVSTYNLVNSDVRGVLKITAPDGSVIYNNTNFGSPDIDGAIPTWLKTIPIPLNSDGSRVLGLYLITYTARIADLTNPTYNVVNNSGYNFIYTQPVVSITQTVDCISPLFKSVDNTNYTVNGIAPTTLTRTHTLDFPFGSAGEGSPLVTAAASLQTGTFYQGTQTTQISTVVVYTLAVQSGFLSSYTVSDTLTGNKEVLVDCTFICNIACCLDSLRTQMFAAAGGVNEVLYQDLKNRFTLAMSLITSAIIDIDCGRGSGVSAVLTQIQTIAQCTSGCQCNDGTPSLVIGLGGSNINVIVQGGGSPVSVTSSVVGDTTTYTITIDSGFVNKVNALHNTSVTSNDDSVTIVQSGSSPVNYDLSVALPALADRMEMKVSFVTSPFIANPASMTITVSDVVITGTKFQSPTIAPDDPLNANWIYLPNSFKVSDFFTGSADNNYKIQLTNTTEYTSTGHTSAAYLKANSIAVTPDVFANDLASGEFYFRFMYSSTGSVSAKANYTMGGQKYELTLVISE